MTTVFCPNEAAGRLAASTMSGTQARLLEIFNKIEGSCRSRGKLVCNLPRAALHPYDWSMASRFSSFPHTDAGYWMPNVR